MLLITTFYINDTGYTKGFISDQKQYICRKRNQLEKIHKFTNNDRFIEII